MYTAIHRLYNHWYLYRRIFFFFLTCTFSTKKVVGAFIEHPFPQEGDIKAVTFSDDGTKVACLSYGSIFPEMMPYTENSARVNFSMITVFDCTIGKTPLYHNILYQYSILVLQSKIHFNKSGDILLTWQKGGIGCLQALSHPVTAGTHIQEKKTDQKEDDPQEMHSQPSKFRFSTSSTLKTLPQHIEMVQWGANNDLAILSVFSELCVINGKTGVTQYKIPGAVWCMTWSPRCGFLVIGEGKNCELSLVPDLKEKLKMHHPNIKLFTAKGEQLQEYLLDYDLINKLSFTEDGRLFLCSEKEEEIYLHNWVMLNPSFVAQYFLECQLDNDILLPKEIACMVSNYIEPELHHRYSLELSPAGQSVIKEFFFTCGASSMVTMHDNGEVNFWNPHNGQRFVRLYDFNFVKPSHGGDSLIWYNNQANQLCLANNNIHKPLTPTLQWYKDVFSSSKITTYAMPKGINLTSNTPFAYSDNDKSNKMIAFGNKNKFIVYNLEKKTLNSQERTNCFGLSTVEISIIFLGLFYTVVTMIKGIMEEGS